MTNWRNLTEGDKQFFNNYLSAFLLASSENPRLYRILVEEAADA